MSPLVIVGIAAMSVLGVLVAAAFLLTYLDREPVVPDFWDAEDDAS